jgi:DNA topoisomerase-3
METAGAKDIPEDAELGELESDAFMDGIAGMLQELVKTYTLVKGTEVCSPPVAMSSANVPAAAGAWLKAGKAFSAKAMVAGLDFGKTTGFSLPRKRR